MSFSFGRRVGALAAVLLAGTAFLASASPASAQVTPGTHATPLVGSGIVANCPPAVPAAVAGGIATSGDVTVGFPAGARCTPLSAAADGQYVIGDSSPLPFSANCAIVDGTVQHGGGVDVPIGTIVNGVAVTQVTTVTAVNTPVTFPGGRTATLNQVISTPTSLTRNAIAFTGGPIVGQVVCGQAAAEYPLALDVSAAGEAVSNVAESLPAGAGSGPGSTLLLVAGIALAGLGLQLALARKLRRAGEAAG